MLMSSKRILAIALIFVLATSLRLHTAEVAASTEVKANNATEANNTKANKTT